MNAPRDDVKILYLAGAGRSGGTLLNRVLGQAEGYVAVGEVHDTWERNFLRQGHCACHQPFTLCPFWSAVIEEAFGSFDQVDAARMAQFRQNFRFSVQPSLLFAAGRRAHASEFAEYYAALSALYRAIAKISGARVIVESSRVASYGTALRQVPGLALYALHLVRDVRGVAASWHTQKEWLKPRGAGLAAMDWVASNLLAERQFRRDAVAYQVLRYEDLLASPQRHVEQIGEFVGEPLPKDLVDAQRQVEIHRYHAVVGNPDAFARGAVKLAAKDDAMSRLNAWQRATALMIGGGLMCRYGYLSRLSPS